MYSFCKQTGRKEGNIKKQRKFKKSIKWKTEKKIDINKDWKKTKRTKFRWQSHRLTVLQTKGYFKKLYS